MTCQRDRPEVQSSDISAPVSSQLSVCRVFVGNEEWVSQQVGSSLHERQTSHSRASTNSSTHRYRRIPWCFCSPELILDYTF